MGRECPWGWLPVLFRWPEFSLWWPEFSFWWPEFSFSIVDEIVWTLAWVCESVALVSMLCFFFVFCGCSL
ncbi:hypothetical protein AMTRI_Chr02g262350 [Amborella trichopoda]